MKRLKISREGIVLIKSFEGFRPRAVQREDGKWVIGYGHTLSAREGASVSEADAELLLQYDLLPVAQAVNDGVEGRVNQHQFDALASFVFSVGVDRFGASDVLERIRAGFSSEAADAMVGWPEPTLPEAALRRRAAERALFVADPDSPVALADLLSAPLPPPPVAATPITPTPITPTLAETAEAPAGEAESSVDAEADTVDFSATAPDDLAEAATPDLSGGASESPVDTHTALDARSAAVAHLLDGGVPDTVVAEAAPSPIATATTDESAIAVDEIPVGEEAPVIEPEAEAPLPTVPEGDTAPEPAPEPVSELSAVADATQTADAAPQSSTDDTVLSAEAAMELPVSQRDSVTEDEADDPQPVVHIPAGTERAAEPVEAVEPVIPITFTPLWNQRSPYGVPTLGRLPPLDAAPAAVQSQTSPEPAETASDNHGLASPPHLGVEPDLPAVTPETELPGSVEPLVLTPSAEGAFASTPRLVWPDDSRDGDDVAQSPLFDEDITLHRTLGPVVRPEMLDDTPGRFNWGETGAYLLMGGFGLVSFGMAMAAFRLASQQPSGSNDTAMIAWVLALIGAACVGVSSYNLYRRWGRSDD